MANIFDLFNPTSAKAMNAPLEDMVQKFSHFMDRGYEETTTSAHAGEIISNAIGKHAQRIREEHFERFQKLLTDGSDLLTKFNTDVRKESLPKEFAEYLQDSGERLILTLDTLRKRGDIFITHESEGCPPVLHYNYETIMDGKDFSYPCNYFLLKILPPDDCSIDETKRPFVIIDPRAGHGPGIGGFKTDSQVGVALRTGHPVYFIAFRREPEPGQYLSYITRAEAEFVREIIRRHPQAPHPVVIGNCQGGWATLLLTASNPDLTGPVVINGSPVATWAGVVGENPMRYLGGICGGTWIPMFLSDIGGGIFDGAHLVQNFELLNPSRTLFRKYVDLYSHIDKGDHNFLEFEKWWGGFFLMTEAEIRWIVEQLFVGNRIVKNEARIEPGRHVDLKAIKAPIIVFASHGDNITPPQQALNWIIETYADVSEIKIRGQKIIYIVHDQIGHLGIFVSSKIAQREHSEVNTTLETIEALAPGLYEMVIEDYEGEMGSHQFTVSFKEKNFDDIRELDDGIDDEQPFAAVARFSEVQAQAYEMFMRPVVKALMTQGAAELSRALHPQRVSRSLVSSHNPAMRLIQSAACSLETTRKPVVDNPFVALEEFWFKGMEQTIDMMRDSRDMAVETLFHSVWNTPWTRHFGKTHETRRTLKNPAELRNLPEVRTALLNINRGGFTEAVIRMFILLAENRGTVRRDRLERAQHLLENCLPFSSLSADQRAMIIQQQTLIATYEPEQAILTLPILLKDENARLMASKLIRYVPGPMKEMTPRTLSMLVRFHDVLQQPHFESDIFENPLETIEGLNFTDLLMKQAAK